MASKQRYITAGVTIAAAAVTAHLMQRDVGTGPAAGNVGPVSAAVAAASPNTEELGLRSENVVTVLATRPQEEEAENVGLAALSTTETENPATITSPEEIPDSETAGVVEPPLPPTEMLMPAPLPQVGTELSERMAAEPEVEEPVVEEIARSRFGLPCGPILSAAEGDPGMVELTLNAPCREAARVEIRHGPIHFTAITDEFGMYRATVPAMEVNASFSADFEDGTSFEASTELYSSPNLDRVALVMDAQSGLQVHALEFGAAYGEAGHVWSGQPRDPVLSSLDGQGYLIELGDRSIESGKVAEIYTYPTSLEGSSGVVRLSVEAEVTARNCGAEVSGQSIERDISGAPVAIAMTVSIPDCDAIGEFLVLKNLLRDLRIASN